MGSNTLLSEEMVAREIVRLVSAITHNYYYNSVNNKEAKTNYEGICCNNHYNPNDDKIYYDVWAGANMRFEISFQAQDPYWKRSIDDFAEHKLVPELYKKLDYYGFATWD